METRRETLKIIGAVSANCAFSFSADELYGQHVHPSSPPVQIQPAAPQFFTEPEFRTVSRIADLIIPPTGTPGAAAADVPQYVDLVVSANPEHQKTFRAGLAWLHRKKFDSLSEARQIELLTPLCEAADRGELKTAGQRFFRLMKSLTADGYYTSRIGLVQELDYKGNTVLAAFPECNHPEHQG